MSDLFYRPIGFDDEEPKKGKFKNVLRRPTDLDLEKEEKIIDVNYNDPNEFLEYLYSKNRVYSNYARDIRSIQRYLEYKKEDKSKDFMYVEGETSTIISPGIVQSSVDKTNSSDSFVISDSKETKPESIAKINYRITLRNSKNIKTNEMIEFVKAFQREAMKRRLYIKCKVLFDSSDGIVFYVDKNNLPGTIKLLEDLKNENVYGHQVLNAINSFGHIQPFAATLYDESYYSIAMHGVEPENTRIITTRGGGLISTFNEYMDYCLDSIYETLMVKYHNDSSKITPHEIYEHMIKYHKERMKASEEIPLWMNNRIYNELEEKTMRL